MSMGKDIPMECRCNMWKPVELGRSQNPPKFNMSGFKQPITQMDPWHLLLELLYSVAACCTLFFLEWFVKHLADF